MRFNDLNNKKILYIKQISFTVFLYKYMYIKLDKNLAKIKRNFKIFLYI